MDGPPSLALTLGRPDIQLSNTSYNKHAPPSLGSMAMAILQLSEPLNDISYNNEQATSVGSVAMARLQLSEPLNDISYNNEKATSMGSVAMVRLQLSDKLTDTSYSYSNEQAPSMGYERGVSQSASDCFSYYARPPSLTDVADREESYSVISFLQCELKWDRVQWKSTTIRHLCLRYQKFTLERHRRQL